MCTVVMVAGRGPLDTAPDELITLLSGAMKGSRQFYGGGSYLRQTRMREPPYWLGQGPLVIESGLGGVTEG